ncbi:MAG: leucine-rich repeat protein [Clostridiales bacterium]|nr:leucine-rich repeat protein [Clostridiales bacterium]
MKFTRRPIVIAVWAVVVVTAIIVTVFACSFGGGNGGGNNGGDNVGGDTGSKYTCTVTFDAGGGLMDGKRLYSVTINKNTTVPRPTVIPERNGHIFWGWNTTGREDDPMWKFDAEKITQDMYIHAVWVKECTVTFYAEHGTFEDGTETFTAKAAYGTKITSPKITPPDEYSELAGWETRRGEAFDVSNDTVKGDMYLYAQWDIKRDVLRQLAPYTYERNAFGYTITGVLDKNVSTVIIPQVATRIDDGAFSNCHELKSVSMHSAVDYIGYNAFLNCDKLTSIVLSSSVEDIGHNAFYGCTALQSISLPNSVTTIGKQAFYGCTALKRVELNDGLTEIGDYAFYGCTALQSISVPDTVTKIGGNVFCGCTALRQVELDAAVETIGDYAFYSCIMLAEIQLPAATIGSHAFDGCTALKSVTVPTDCVIDGYAFNNCTALTRAELHCQTIAAMAFDGCTALAEIVIGDEVRTINSCAFYYCTALTELDIPDGVTKLEAAFANCYSLRRVSIGNGVTDIAGSTFRNCYNLRSVTIGSGVKTIGYQAFAYCYSLLSVTIPSTVQTIYASAFYSCYRLAEVYDLSGSQYNFTASVTVHTAASDASVLHDTDDGFTFRVHDDGTVSLVDYFGDDEDIVLPDDYDGKDYAIAQYALAYNPRLRSVQLSAGVKEIGYRILLDSNGITSLTVDSGNTTYSAAGNCVILTADKKFVLGCKTSVIPSDGSVTSIGAYVFCCNDTITDLVIPDSVTVVDSWAFYGCNKLGETVDNVRYVDKWVIGTETSSDDENLDLEIRSGTLGIAYGAFSYTARIRSVKFNAELKYVGNDAFSHCTGLTKVIMNYGLLEIGDMAFCGCNGLQEVVVPDSVQKLDVRAFLSCNNLKYVKLPAGIRNLNGRTFDGCSALEGVVIPRSVEYFAYEEFEGCPATVKIYYEGTEEEWNKIYISTNDNDVLNNATKYFYSETKIAGVNCWHYDADGKPTTEYN